MPTDEHYVVAQYHLDKAERVLTALGDGAPAEIRAQVGIGYALLAVMDELEKLREAK